MWFILKRFIYHTPILSSVRYLPYFSVYHELGREECNRFFIPIANTDFSYRHKLIFLLIGIKKSVVRSRVKREFFYFFGGEEKTSDKLKKDNKMKEIKNNEKTNMPNYSRFNDHMHTADVGTGGKRR